MAELKVYDGASEACDGHICVAVNGKIFDVTRVSEQLIKYEGYRVF